MVAVPGRTWYSMLNGSMPRSWSAASILMGAGIGRASVLPVSVDGEDAAGAVLELGEAAVG